MTDQWRPARPEVLALLEQSQRTVPFVGAGMSVPCGLPNAVELAKRLRESGLAVTDFAHPDDLNQVVDALLAAGADRAELLSFVAAQYDLAASGARPSAALRALARTPSHCIVTFNYDHLIESAADLEGIPHRSFTWRQLPYEEDVEVGADHELYIVHLHGDVGDPSSLVLDSESYRQMTNNGEVGTWLRVLLSHHNAWFFGTKLDEIYLQNVFLSLRHKQPRHVFIDHQPVVTEVSGGRAPIFPERYGIYTEALPEGRFDLLDEFCAHLTKPRFVTPPTPQGVRTGTYPKELTAGQVGQSAPVVVTDFMGAREWTHKALTELTDTHPEEAKSLRDLLATRDAPLAVSEIVRRPPGWASDGSWQLWVAIARLAEQDGDWKLAKEAWDITSRRPGADEVRWLVAAAIAAHVAGEEDEHARYLQLAAAKDPHHPRLRLEQASELDDTSAIRTALAPLLDEDGDVGALANAQSAIAALRDGDIDSAQALLSRGRAISPNLKQLGIVEANVVVHQARLAVVAGRPTDFDALARAKQECLSLREDLLEQRRFAESTGLLMLAADATAVESDFAGAGRVLQQATTDERSSLDAAHVLAESALRAQQALVAAEFLDHSDDTDLGRRLRAQVALASADPDERRGALAALDQLIADSESERLPAALFRATRTHEVPGAQWSADAEAVLRQAGEENLVLVFKALQARTEGDREGAAAMLQPFRRERWAAEPMFEWAVEDGDEQAAADLAETLLAAGPDQPARLRCARALGRAGRVDRARAESLTVAQDPTAGARLRSAAYAMLVSAVSVEERDYAKALSLLDEWRSVDATDLRQVWGRLWVLHRLARHQDALDLLLASQPEPRDVHDAHLASVLYARLPDRVEALERMTALADHFGGEDEGLEQRVVLHSMLLGAEDDALLPPELNERIRLDKFLRKFPKSALAKGAITLDQLKRLVTESAERDHGVWKQVDQGEAPLGAFGTAVGLDVGSALTRAPYMPIGFGLEQLDERERDAARDGLRFGAVFDPNAISMVALVGEPLSDLVEALFVSASFVAQGTLDELDEGVGRLIPEGQTGTREHIAVDGDGELVRIKWSPDAVRDDRRRAEAALALAQRLGVTPDLAPGELPETDLTEHETSVRSILGTFLAARRRQLAVYSDDRFVRALLLQAGVKAFGTTALLDALHEHNHLTEEQVDQLRDRMRQRRASGVTPRVQELLRHAAKADGAVNDAVRGALVDPAPWRADYVAQLRRVVDFLREVNLAYPEHLEAWTGAVLDAMQVGVALSRVGGAGPVTAREATEHHATGLLLMVLASALDEEPPGLLKRFRPALQKALPTRDVHVDLLPAAMAALERFLHDANLSSGGTPIRVVAQLPFADQLRVIGLPDRDEYLRHVLLRQLPLSRAYKPMASTSNPSRSGRRAKRRRK